VSIFNRGGYWHYDFIVKGERFRGSTRIEASTKEPPKPVRDYVRQQRERAALGEISRAVLTLEQASGRWFSAKIDGKKSAATVAQRLEIALRLMGPDTSVTAIDSPDVEEAIQRRRVETTRQGKTPTNSTVNRDLIDTTLRPLLRYAKRVLKQPVKDIDWGELRLSEPKERVRAFTPDELAAWRAKLPEWHRPIMDFIARYGVRLREAFFHPDQFDGARIVWRPDQRKNGRGHVIPLLPEDIADIAARVGRARRAKLTTVWFKEQPAEGDSPPRLLPVHWRGFQSASKAAQKAVGLSDARPVHDLRHHAATAALRRSGNVLAVKKLLGHDSITSTQRYAHADDADVLAALGHNPHHTAAAQPGKPRVFKHKRRRDTDT
jgi:integrase